MRRNNVEAEFASCQYYSATFERSIDKLKGRLCTNDDEMYSILFYTLGSIEVLF